MAFACQIIQTEAQPVLSIRTVTSIGNLPNELGRAYGMIYNYLKELGEEALGPAFSAYYNMDMEKLEVEIGFPVAKTIKGKGEIMAREIPAGKMAVTYHKGPYKDMTSTYDYLTAWMNKKGCVPSGVAYEFYFNAPGDVSQSELLTQIAFLLK